VAANLPADVATVIVADCLKALNADAGFIGTVADDGRTIEGLAETSHDEGATWELDFEITYRKVGP